MLCPQPFVAWAIFRLYHPFWIRPCAYNYLFRYKHYMCVCTGPGPSILWRGDVGVHTSRAPGPLHPPALPLHALLQGSHGGGHGPQTPVARVSPTSSASPSLKGHIDAEICPAVFLEARVKRPSHLTDGRSPVSWC